MSTHKKIPGTPIFGSDEAQQGYALNKMCFSFNEESNRKAFLADEDAYCAKYGLTPAQREAVRHRNVLELIEAGGNVYYLAKLAGIFGLNVQDIGAQQTGMTLDAFKAKLQQAGEAVVMARIVGGIGTTHVPAIGGAIARELQQDPYWKPFFDGFIGARQWLARVKPDVVVVFYNDHGLNFFLDKLPTFAVGAAKEYKNSDEGWGLPVAEPYPGDVALSWHLIEALVADDFDVTMCQDMLVDHALTIPMSLLWPGKDNRPVRIVPIEINTVQHPLPSAARCLKLGQSVGRAIETYQEDVNVLIVGTGGLSHQLDGTRAGFINKKFDLMCMDKIVSDPAALTKYSITELVELAGTQGVELLNWIAMRGALTGRVWKVHSNYHIPISNTASALLVVENEAAQIKLSKVG